jgi:hypothetical protein
MQWVVYAKYIDLQCTSPVNVPFAKLGPHKAFVMHVWPLLADPSQDANFALPNQASKFAAHVFKVHPFSMPAGRLWHTRGLGPP